MRTEVGQDTLAISVHCVLAFFPVGWANLTFFLNVSEGIDDTQIFRNVSSDRHVIDAFVKNHPLLVNKVGRPIRNAVTVYQDGSGFLVHSFIRLVKNSEGVGQVTVAVGKKGVSDALDPATILGGIQPCKMDFRRVTGGTDNQSVPLFKFSQGFLKSMKLGRTDESEILGIPKEQNFLFLAHGLVKYVQGKGVPHFIYGVNGKVRENFSNGCHDI